jgi:polygalacturonase
MRSHVTLDLQRGAAIIGSDTLADYPIPRTPFVDAVGQTRGGR